MLTSPQTSESIVKSGVLVGLLVGILWFAVTYLIHLLIGLQWYDPGQPGYWEMPIVAGIVLVPRYWPDKQHVAQYIIATALAFYLVLLIFTVGYWVY